ncbi:MAG TPA: nitroreductase family protein, partial [Armatimonadota bacterium]|nr:nitroreductase family protein [Armatimonadota bacterium]
MRMTIDHIRCTRCQACVAACPERLIGAGPVTDPDLATYCLRCGHCLAACPAGAIAVEGVGEAPAGAGVSSAALLALLRARRSGRQYTNEPVAREHLRALLDAAATAPSAKNFRAVKVYVYTDAATITALRAATVACYRRLRGLLRLPGHRVLYRLLGVPAALHEKLDHDARFLTATDGDPLLHGARTLLAFTAPRGWAQGVGDAWLAAHSAVLYAETIPLATCYNGFVAQAAGMDGRVRRALGVPARETTVAVLTLGYPAARPHRALVREGLAAAWDLEG